MSHGMTRRLPAGEQAAAPHAYRPHLRRDVLNEQWRCSRCRREGRRMTRRPAAGNKPLCRTRTNPTRARERCPGGERHRGCCIYAGLRVLLHGGKPRRHMPGDAWRGDAACRGWAFARRFIGGDDLEYVGRTAHAQQTGMGRKIGDWGRGVLSCRNRPGQVHHHSGWWRR